MNKLSLLFLLLPLSASAGFRYGDSVAFDSDFYGNCTGKVVEEMSSGDYHYYRLADVGCSTGFYDYTGFWINEKQLRLRKK